MISYFICKNFKICIKEVYLDLIYNFTLGNFNNPQTCKKKMIESVKVCLNFKSKAVQKALSCSSAGYIPV